MKNICLTFVFATLLFSISCNNDPLIIPNEEELITTLTYTLTPVTGGDPVEFIFQDLDGDGGNDPMIVDGTLAANSTYTGEVVLLNEIENPAENITDEVREEQEDHQFFYQVSSGLNATVEYDDTDGNGDPLGISTRLTTMTASNGQITIILRHEPDKNASGVSGGDITNAGGETDISITFDVLIQ